MSLNQKYQLKKEAESEPLTLAEVQTHLKVDCFDTAENEYINSLIVTARKMAESHINQLIGLQEWALYQDDLSYYTPISKLPVTEITSVKYKDSTGSMVATTDYQSDLIGLPAAIEFETLPTLYDKGFNKVEILFKAGMTDIPSPIKSAMLLIIGSLYENRQDEITGTIISEIPTGSKYLLSPYVHHEFR